MDEDREILEEFIEQVFKDSEAYKKNFKNILEQIKQNKEYILKI